MEDVLKSNIKRTLGYDFSDEEYQLFSNYLFERSFDKKTILAEEGEICKYVYFILEGSAYSYFTDVNGDKHAIQFALESYWITDHYSLFSSQPGLYTIETLENCRLLLLNKDNFEKLCAINHKFEHFFMLLLQKAFIALQYRIAKTNGADAGHRYDEFSKLYPHFVNRIPQYLIASYLGIKPQSLSRIRKECVTKVKLV